MIEKPILRTITKLVIPFIIMFGFYVQFHGDYSPGGGFQAGAILASALVLYAIVFGTDKALKVFPYRYMLRGAAIGCLLYGGVGVWSMMEGGQFLNYSVLSDTVDGSQRLGILIIELGVGITVCSVMMFLFFTFANFEKTLRYQHRCQLVNSADRNRKKGAS